MPIYEYRCDACAHIMEVWAKMSDPPPETCESCMAASPVRIISRTSFQLKGGGWYAQGYGGEAGKAPGDKPAAEGAKADAGGAGEPQTEGKPTESKPAEAKPAEAKPAEAKPADSKPAETKPTPSTSGSGSGSGSGSSST